MPETTAPPRPLREDIDALLERLARIEAQRSAIGAVADELHGATVSPTLISALATLECDLTLAARAASRVHDQIGS